MIVDKSSTYLASDTPSYGTSETNPTYGGVSASTSLPSYDIPTATAPVLSNTKPLLVTPVIEPSPIPPKGSGASVVAEPQLGTPIVKNDISSPIFTFGGGIGGGIGGGAGAGSGAGSGAGADASANMPKKPNYLLYGGILLAVIVAYKLLSSKKEN
jgi:hypothetical protein